MYTYAIILEACVACTVWSASICSPRRVLRLPPNLTLTLCTARRLGASVRAVYRCAGQPHLCLFNCSALTGAPGLPAHDAYMMCLVGLFGTCNPV